MLRSLLWKEWREQRAVAIVGVLLAIGMPLLLTTILTLTGRGERLGELANLLPIANWVLLWPLAAVATAATMLSSDRNEGRLAFLLSRPVPRHTVLAVKIGVAFGVASIVVLSGQLVAGMVSGWLEVTAPIDAETRAALDLGAFDPVLTRGVAAFAGLTFMLATLLSLVLDRALPVAGIAAIGSLAIVGGNVWVWSRTDYLPQVGAPTTWPPAALAAILVPLAFVCFARGEMLRGKAHLGRVLGLGGTVVVLWLAGVGAAAAWTMRAPSGPFLIGGFTSGPNGTPVAVVVGRPDRAASRTVALVEANGALRLIGSRLTESPAVSPDGRFVAYPGFAGRAGLRSDSRRLLLWDRTTGRERELARAAAGTGLMPDNPMFSPDSRYLAVRLGNDIVVADTMGERRARHVGCSGYAYLRGWDPHSGHVVRRCGRQLDWIDPADGTILRSLGQSPGQAADATVEVTSDTASVVRGVHLRTAELERRAVHSLLSLESGAEHVLRNGTPSEWYGVRRFEFASEHHPGSPLVAYTYTVAVEVEGAASPRTETELRLLDMSTGEDRLLDTRDDFHDYRLDFGDDPSQLRVIATTSTYSTEGEGDLSVYDLRTGARRVLATLPRDVRRYWSSMRDGRLLYVAEPMVPPGIDDRTLAEIYLTGWYRSLRSIDLATGEDSLVFDGGVE